MSRPHEPRLSLAPLVEILDQRAHALPHAADIGRGNGRATVLAELVGISYRAALRYTSAGAVLERHAERLAAELGHHPATLWPDFYNSSTTRTT